MTAATRRDIGTARKTGQLGDLPAEVKIRVRSEDFSGGASVDVSIDAPHSWAWAMQEDRYGDQRELPTPAARELGDKLAAILRRHLDASDAGYVWGAVHSGCVLASIARRGFVPGED